MKTTIRNRAAAVAIAGIASLAVIGLASGPALAASPSAATTAAQQPQSVHYPTDAADYADELVIAWGQGNISRVEAFASKGAIAVLSNHGNADATHWDRTGVEGAAGTTYVNYENTVTGETMAVGVSSEAAANGEANAVHKIQFS
ncbi:MAG: hypothetical protein L0H76_08885, partial [Brevibacterium sp.]|nr:hypothetical protein [Brevibacterium sp.]MDN5909693.1 hypothetical protein [Brevibacterium sp.]